jgi:single-strand selective monofunctional uracil DNA glycosylase
MTIDEFRAAALKVTGAIEAAHMNHPDFRVKGKIFASLGYPDDGWGMVNLTPEQQQSFMKEAPEMFAPCAGAWGKQVPRVFIWLRPKSGFWPKLSVRRPGTSSIRHRNGPVAVILAALPGLFQAHSMASSDKSSSTGRELIAAARELLAQVRCLAFKSPVTHVYNPLEYAWSAHEQYLRRFGLGKKRAVFLGMNPGPFGMSQTGVPFGEIAAVRDWMGIRAKIGKPRKEHPKRPVQGFDCARSEVSGRRLWGLFAERFETAEGFFANYFVANYCPLAFMSASGSNITPDKLQPSEREKLFRICDEHLRRTLEILEPDWLIGVGDFTTKRGRLVVGPMNIEVGQILHPSPASPAANRGWSEVAARQLQACGLSL